MLILIKERLDNVLKEEQIFNGKNSKDTDSPSSSSTQKQQQRKYYSYSIRSILQYIISYTESIIEDIIIFKNILLYRICYPFRLMARIVLFIHVIFQLFFQYTINLFYFFYVTVPLLIISYVWSYILQGLAVFCRKNRTARKLIIHITEIVKLGERIWEKARTATLWDIIAFIGSFLIDVLRSWLVPPKELDKSRSIIELSELLAYEETISNLKDGSSLQQQQQQQEERRARKYMHHYVPFNPFKATIKLHTPLTSLNAKPKSQSSSQSYYQTLLSPVTNRSFFMPSFDSADHTGQRDIYNIDRSDLSQSFLEQYSLLHEADTPASFPPTPFSRAHVMNRSADRVNSVMFGARDRLRQDAQSVSTDKFSRHLAKEAKNSGYLATFDPKKSSENIALSCGNHCVMKVGDNFCGSTQSMVPISNNHYVYFEFSMTVSNDQIPSLALGLSPADCPLNVMVGSWPGSLAINTEGHLIVGSQWFQPTVARTVQPGATVGFLVLIPSECDNGAVLSDSSSGDANFIDASPGDGKEEPSTSGPTSSSSDSQQATDDSVTEGKIEDGATTNKKTINTQLSVQINIDGHPCEYPAGALQKIASEIQLLKASLYPTVGLISGNTRVWCRFCEADVVYRRRNAIGAPVNTKVYCLDGSVLLEENQ